MSKWNKRETVALISLYKKYDLLYDSNSPDYLDRVKRARAYTNILREINKVRKNCTMYELKTKIKTLRNQFTRERQKITNSSMSDSEDEYQPKLWCYKELSFLEDRGVLKDEKDADYVLPDDSKNGDPLNPLAGSSASPKPLSKLEKNQNKALAALKMAKELVEKHKQKELGREEAFCNFLCKELKKIRSDEKYEELQYDILELVRWKIKEDRSQRDMYSPSLSDY